jgi:hypothetical protein
VILLDQDAVPGAASIGSSPRERRIWAWRRPGSFAGVSTTQPGGRRTGDRAHVGGVAVAVPTAAAESSARVAPLSSARIAVSRATLSAAMSTPSS